MEFQTHFLPHISLHKMVQEFPFLNRILVRGYSAAILHSKLQCRLMWCSGQKVTSEVSSTFPSMGNTTILPNMKLYDTGRENVMQAHRTGEFYSAVNTTLQSSEVSCYNTCFQIYHPHFLHYEMPSLWLQDQDIWHAPLITCNMKCHICRPMVSRTDRIWTCSFTIMHQACIYSI